MERLSALAREIDHGLAFRGDRDTRQLGGLPRVRIRSLADDPPQFSKTGLHSELQIVFRVKAIDEGVSNTGQFTNTARPDF